MGIGDDILGEAGAGRGFDSELEGINGMNIEQEITALQERNARVEADKAWETSCTRRVFLAVVTYIVAAIWLSMIGENGIWLKAVVPTGGYILSTLSLPFIRKWWLSV